MAEYDHTAVSDTPAPINLHDLLESVRGCDEHIAALQKQKQEYLSLYHDEKDKLDAHYSIVMSTPQPDPGPKMGRF